MQLKAPGIDVHQFIPVIRRKFAHRPFGHVGSGAIHEQVKLVELVIHLVEQGFNTALICHIDRLGGDLLILLCDLVEFGLPATCHNDIDPSLASSSAMASPCLFHCPL